MIELKLVPLTWREYKRGLTAYFIIRFLVEPTVSLFIFAVAFSSVVMQRVEFAGVQTSYLLFLVPGLAAAYTYGSFTMTYQLVFAERSQGMLAILLSSGMSKLEYVLSKILYLLGYVGAITVYILLGGAMISKELPLTPLNSALFLASMVLATTFWCSLGFILAIFVKRVDVRDILMSVMGTLIPFCSTVYYPLYRSPWLIRTIGWINPISAVANTMRARFLGLPLSELEAISWIQLILYTVVALVLAVRSIRRLSVR